MTDWIERPLSAIAAGLRRGDVTAVGLAEEAIDYHQRGDAALQAYKSWDAPGALAQAAAASGAVATDSASVDSGSRCDSKLTKKVSTRWAVVLLTQYRRQTPGGLANLSLY